MKLDQPFVRLPFSFDVDRLKTELAQFDESSWMAHPNRVKGNAAIPLISHLGEDNDDFTGHMQPTPHLQRCAYMQQIMASFGEVLSRSRLMRLAPGCEVSNHVDFNYHWYTRVRIHIPITTYPEVIFHCGDQSMHMRAGECWIFDSWRRHNVINGSEHQRVHFVIDTAGSARFWRMVKEMQDPASARAVESLSFDPTADKTIRTERYNIAPVMAPGEMQALAQDLIEDIKANPDNDTELLSEYEMILADLCHDWRQLWLLHGHQQSGWKQYKELLENTASRLRPNPRSLITASNDVGANPIIMQRILRAALHVGMRL